MFIQRKKVELVLLIFVIISAMIAFSAFKLSKPESAIAADENKTEYTLSDFVAVPDDGIDFSSSSKAISANLAPAENQNIKFATLIHPSVKLNRHIKIGEGCIIYQNVIMTVNIEIGDHVIISPKCGIGHDSKIHDYVTLLWNVNVSGSVDIKEGATMGSGSTVIQGLTIGEGSFVGAGACVIRDVEDNKTAVGVPTRYV